MARERWPKLRRSAGPNQRAERRLLRVAPGERLRPGSSPGSRPGGGSGVSGKFFPPRSRTEAPPRARQKVSGWGGRDRTSEWRNQNPLPYRLATPQRGAVLGAALVKPADPRIAPPQTHQPGGPPQRRVAPRPPRSRTGRNTWRPIRSSAPAGSRAARSQRRAPRRSPGKRRAPALPGRCAAARRSAASDARVRPARRQRRRRRKPALRGRGTPRRVETATPGIDQHDAAAPATPARPAEISPMPPIRAGRPARHTGTSAPSPSADPASPGRQRRRRHNRHSSRSAAAASAEPPPMPDATGRRLSSTSRARAARPSARRQRARRAQHQVVGLPQPRRQTALSLAGDSVSAGRRAVRRRRPANTDEAVEQVVAVLAPAQSRAGTG